LGREPSAGGYHRLAGSGRLPDGRRLTWALAEGARGRRWRATTTGRDGRLEESLLLEVAPDGRPVKLELASEAGLLSLHPEPAADAIHGNTVTPWGMHHHALRWSPAHVLVVTGSPVTATVAVRLLAERVGVGEGASIPVVEVSGGLVVRAATWRVARVAEARWRLLAADGGDILTVEPDAYGVPGGLDDAETWPLELDEAG
jgi:hypothetical protein